MKFIARDVDARLAPVDPDGLARIDGVVWSEAANALDVESPTLGLKSLFRSADPIA